MSFRKPARRWPRFSLRSLVVLLLLASLGGAAFHYRLQSAERRATAVKRLRQFSGFVRYENHEQTNREPAPSGRISDWLIMHLGWDFLHHVGNVCIDGRREFSDDDFASACQLRSLHSLRLGTTVVTDNGLQPISQLKALRRFSISSPHIGDHGMDHLAQLHQLERLTLHEINLTDAGLAKLAALENLEVLSIKRTNVTPQGMEKLRSELPSCDIEYLPLPTSRF